MKQALLQRLRCPQTSRNLVLEPASAATLESPNLADEIMEGWLVSEDGEHRYPIRNGIPRFVPESNYADNFGMQWNHFAKPNSTATRAIQFPLIGSGPLPTGILP